jgi:uncharacterized protein YdeI (YjbR/CyaY-like superfamily)
MAPPADQRLVEPLSRAEWRAWLAEHSDDLSGVWLVLHKGAGAALSYSEAVEEAVAAGWIDSKANKLDAFRFKLWVAPRNKGSIWAPSNKERVARLTEQGLMMPRGIAVVEAARADGSWEALTEVLELRIPPDLREALDAQPRAAAYFEKFPPSSKQMILEWIRQAKTSPTRQRRIEETVAAAEQNIRVHDWRRSNRAAREGSNAGDKPGEREDPR